MSYCHLCGAGSKLRCIFISILYIVGSQIMHHEQQLGLLDQLSVENTAEAIERISVAG